MENLRYIDRLGRGLPMVYREAITNKKETLALPIYPELIEEMAVRVVEVVAEFYTS